MDRNKIRKAMLTNQCVRLSCRPLIHSWDVKTSISRLWQLCVWDISVFRREVDDNCGLVVYYAASSGNFLPKFRGNLSVPFSGIHPLKMGPIGRPEPSIINCHYSLRNNRQPRNFHLCVWDFVITISNTVHYHSCKSTKKKKKVFF
jgi:hypothetical protein